MLLLKKIVPLFISLYGVVSAINPISPPTPEGFVLLHQEEVRAIAEGEINAREGADTHHKSVITM
jgi:hypothetical protein